MLLDDQEAATIIVAADTRKKATKDGAMEAFSTIKKAKTKPMTMKTVMEAMPTNKKPATKMMAMKAVATEAPKTS